MHDDANTLYCIGGRTGFGLTRCADAHRATAFAQDRAGLHHVCFRARSREDVDAVHGLVRELGATIVRAPEDGRWAPGYYSILFEDPDGIRLEVNYIPGKGLLAEDAARRFSCRERSPARATIVLIFRPVSKFRVRGVPILAGDRLRPSTLSPFRYLLRHGNSQGRMIARSTNSKAILIEYRQPCWKAK